jgi:hypothetical protein
MAEASDAQDARMARFGEIEVRMRDHLPRMLEHGAG